MKNISLMIIIIIFLPFSTYAKEVTVFGITLGDDIRNYDIEFEVYPESRFTQQRPVSPPEPNKDFQDYKVSVTCRDMGIYMITAKGSPQIGDYHDKKYKFLMDYLSSKYIEEGKKKAKLSFGEKDEYGEEFKIEYYDVVIEVAKLLIIKEINQWNTFVYYKLANVSEDKCPIDSTGL